MNLSWLLCCCLFILFSHFGAGMRVQMSRVSKTNCQLYQRIKVNIFNSKTTVTLNLHESSSNILDNNIEMSVSSQELVYSTLSRFCIFQGNVEGTSENAFGRVVDHIFSAVFVLNGVEYVVPDQEVLSMNSILHSEIKPSSPGGSCHVGDDGTTKMSSTSTKNGEKQQNNIRYKRAVSKSSILANSVVNHTVSNKRYLELALVGDKKMVTKAGSESNAILRLVEIANYVNGMYNSLGMTVVLTQVIVWTSGDPFVITSNPSITLENFAKYRMLHMTTVRHDAAHLVTAEPMSGGTIGLANLGSLCRLEDSTGINLDNAALSLDVAATVAHELGHNLGMTHDADSCACSLEGGCIMAAYAPTITPILWSSCSIKEYNDYQIHNGPGYCTSDKPTFMYQDSSKSSVCGNGIVESGEDCDCGPSEQFCPVKCCNTKTCKFTNGATCASGECCNQDTCKLKTAGNVCRSSSSECDLTEYCNGTSEWCPVNDVKVNGASCISGNSHCYDGECTTRAQQCSSIYSDLNSPSTDTACEFLATQGTPSGYCSYTLTSNNPVTYSYAACSEEDKRCGTLYCMAKSANFNWLFYGGPARWTHITQGSNTKSCYVTLMDMNPTGKRDPALVANGVECGSNKMCVDSICRSVSEFTSSCPTCNGNGDCTKSGLCFCKDGFAPPDCKNVGCGGSSLNQPVCNTNTTQTTTTTIGTTTTTIGTTTTKRNDQSLSVNFLLNASYDQHVIDKSQFVETTKTQLVSFMSVSTNQVTQLDCVRGSIKLTFVLVSSGGNSLTPTQAFDTLSAGINNGTFSIVGFNGTHIFAIPSSLKSEPYNNGGGASDPGISQWVWIGIGIGAAVVVIFVLVIIIAVTRKPKTSTKRPNKDNEATPQYPSIGHANASYMHSHENIAPRENKYYYY